LSVNIHTRCWVGWDGWVRGMRGGIDVLTYGSRTDAGDDSEWFGSHCSCVQS
jgi:hypothetical protein